MRRKSYNKNGVRIVRFPGGRVAKFHKPGTKAFAQGAAKKRASGRRLAKLYGFAKNRRKNPKRRVTKYMSHEDARKVFDRYYAVHQSREEAYLRSPDGEAARQALNKKQLRAKRNPYVYEVIAGSPKRPQGWVGRYKTKKEAKENKPLRYASYIKRILVENKNLRSNPTMNYKRDLSDAIKAHNRGAHNSANDNYNLANRLGSNHARTICRLAAASHTGESRSKVSLSIIGAWADGLLPVGAGYRTQDRHEWMLPYIATLPRSNPTKQLRKRWGTQKGYVVLKKGQRDSRVLFSGKEAAEHTAGQLRKHGACRVVKINPRVSKTELLYVLQGQYGQGWEDISAAISRAEIRDDKRAYQENEGGSYRIIQRRVRKAVLRAMHAQTNLERRNPRRKTKARRNPSDAFNVYLGRKLIDTVFATKGSYTAAEMKQSLINHDGYDSRIRVTKVKRK